MKRLAQAIYTTSAKQVPAAGLGVFRIVFGLVMLLTAIQIASLSRLTFDVVPYVESSSNSLPFVVTYLWIAALVFLILGLATRIFAVVNYACVVYLLSFMLYPEWEYHLDYMIAAYSLFMIFMPVGKSLSLDSLLRRTRYPHFEGQPLKRRTVAQGWYLWPLFLGAGFVYFDSVFWKLDSWHWVQGLGVWLPASHPVAAWHDLGPLLDQPWIMALASWVTLIYEAIFIFAMWFKRGRIALFFVGIGLHLSIAIVFPIPIFGIGGGSVLLLLVPPEFWTRIGDRLRSGTPRLTVYYDGNCGICNRTRGTIETVDILHRTQFKSLQIYAETEPPLEDVSETELLHDLHSVDLNKNVYVGYNTYIRIAGTVPTLWFMWPILAFPPFAYIGRKIYRKIANGRHTGGGCPMPPTLPPENQSLKRLKIAGLTTGVVVVCLAQIVVTATGSLAALGLPSKSDATVSETGRIVREIGRPLVGMTDHPVFVSNHFDGFDGIVTLQYVPDASEEMAVDPWFPLTEGGRPGSLLTSERFWVAWTFRGIRPQLKQSTFENQVRRYSAWWAVSNGIGLQEATFLVMSKSFSTPTKWEPKQLEKSRQSPWDVIGIAKWTNGRFEYINTCDQVQSKESKFVCNRS